MKKTSLKKIVQQFIKATNAYDVEAAMTLFASNAVIDDVSVGEKFKETAGVRNYLEKFFVGYHTVTKLESLELLNELQAIAQVDFTGDFGHETGGLNFTFNADGLIITIDAHLD
jgi:ketosteroid isomerase-like protein